MVRAGDAAISARVITPTLPELRTPVPAREPTMTTVSSVGDGRCALRAAANGATNEIAAITRTLNTSSILPTSVVGLVVGATSELNPASVSAD